MKRIAVLAVTSVIACRPDLDSGEAAVTSVRVLAVRAEPAEARPGVQATYQALVADPSASNASESILWRWCTAPKPPSENNVVSSTCLDPVNLVPAGSGAMVLATTPANACSLFGPDTPPGDFRPRDADVTGGYYAPIRADIAGADPTFYLARIICNLAEAPTDIAAAYARDYPANKNPHLLPLGARVDGREASFDAIAAGSSVELTAAWSVEDAEVYVSFDRASQTLKARRESMRVSWYSTAGQFETGSTGRAEDDPVTTTQNVWTAPDMPSITMIWVVLRDSRGGVGFATYHVSIGR